MTPAFARIMWLPLCRMNRHPSRSNALTASRPDTSGVDGILHQHRRWHGDFRKFNNQRLSALRAIFQYLAQFFGQQLGRLW